MIFGFFLATLLRLPWKTLIFFLNYPMKNFLTLSVCASALMLAACGTTADQVMPVTDDAAMSSSEAMMSSSEDGAMMSSSEDGVMMKVDVDAKMMKSSEAGSN